MTDSIFSFNQYQLDTSRFELSLDGKEIEIAPQTARLLIYLIRNRDRTVPRDELLETLWGGVAVGETSLHQAIKLARRATGDSGTKQIVIKTVRGIGFRFVADVRAQTTSHPSRDRRRDSAFIGREIFLQECDAHFDRAMAGHGTVLLLGGEPGIGKTRLAEEIARRALERGARLARSSGFAQSGAPPYWAWIRLFRDLSRSNHEKRFPEEVEALLSKRSFPRAGSVPQNDLTIDDADRFRIYDAVAQSLHRLSSARPLVLVLDDLHRAGAATLSLLSFVTSEIEGAKILLIGTFRQSELLQNAHSAEILAEIERNAASSSILIPPLEPRHTEDLLRHQMNESIAPALVERAVARSGGNPFYAIEIARLLSRWSAADTAKLDPDQFETSLPSGIHQILAGRFETLDAMTRQVLRTATLMGRQIDSHVLTIAEPDCDTVSALTEATEAGLIYSIDPIRKRFSFSHDLVGDALRSELGVDGEDQKERHLRLAEAFIAQPKENLLSAAHHLGSASPLGDPTRAIDYLRRAGEQARTNFDEDQAWYFSRLALEIVERSGIDDPRLRVGLLIDAGKLAVRGTRPDEARGILRAAITIARDSQLAEAFCRAAIELAYRDEILGAEEHDVARLLEEALDDYSDRVPHLRVPLLSALSVKLRYKPGALGRSVRYSDEAVRLAKAFDDAAALARALEDASFIHWSVENPERWIDLNHEIVAAASEAGDVALVFRGVKGLATGFMEVGDRERMEREMQRCTELARSAPAPYLQGVCALHKGATALLDDELEEGEAHAIRATGFGLPAITQLSAVQLLYHRLETGRAGELEAPTRNFMEGTPGISAWRFALARILAEQDRFDEAQHELRKAGALFALPRDRNWLAAGALGAETAVLIGDNDRCRELLEALEPHARVNVVLGHGSMFYGNTGFFVGLLLMALNQLDRANIYLTSAHAMHERMRAPRWIERSQRALSKCESNKVAEIEA